MKATDVIKRDHTAAEKLFAEFVAASGDERKAMESKILDALTAHETMEDKHFYPALRDKDIDAAAIFSELEGEQMKLAASVLGARALPGDKSKRIMEMINTVLVHAKKEERELLPAAELAFSDVEMEELGAKMEPDSAVAKAE